MNPIEIGKAIADYGVPIITGIFLVLFCRLVMYFVAQQTEDRTYYRHLVTNDMKDLHHDSVENAKLNNQTIILQKDMAKEMEKHNGYTRKLGEKTLEALDIVCDRMNGGSPASLAIKKELEWYKTRGIVDRRETDKKVKLDRRK